VEIAEIAQAIGWWAHRQLYLISNVPKRGAMRC
jgi:hypothetical protein